MPITIGSNIASLKIQRSLDRSSQALSTVYERLSSGQRINKASDDAAGLAIASTLQAHSEVFTQGIRNTNDGFSLLNIAQGALQELSQVVTRQKELAEQAANGIYSGKQRKALDVEMNALVKEYNRLVQSTSFNGQAILDGTDDAFRLQQGFGLDGSLFLNLGNSFGVAAGDGTFTVNSTTTIGSGQFDNFLADFNTDGILDFVTVDSTSNQLTVGFGNGSGSFQNSITLAIGTSSQSGTVGDFNGDGIADIAAGGSYGVIYYSNGSGGFLAAQTFSSGATSHLENNLGFF